MTEAKKRKAHSAEFKAKVGLEAVRGVKTVNEIAQLHGVLPLPVYLQVPSTQFPGMRSVSDRAGSDRDMHAAELGGAPCPLIIPFNSRGIEMPIVQGAPPPSLNALPPGAAAPVRMFNQAVSMPPAPPSAMASYSERQIYITRAIRHLAENPTLDSKAKNGILIDLIRTHPLTAPPKKTSLATLTNRLITKPPISPEKQVFDLAMTMARDACGVEKKRAPYPSHLFLLIEGGKQANSLSSGQSSSALRTGFAPVWKTLLFNTRHMKAERQTGVLDHFNRSFDGFCNNSNEREELLSINREGFLELIDALPHLKDGSAGLGKGSGPQNEIDISGLSAPEIQPLPMANQLNALNILKRLSTSMKSELRQDLETALRKCASALPIGTPLKEYIDTLPARWLELNDTTPTPAV